MKIIIEDNEIENEIRYKLEKKIDNIAQKELQRILHAAFIDYLKMFNIRDVVKVYEQGHKKKPKISDELKSFFEK